MIKSRHRAYYERTRETQLAAAQKRREDNLEVARARDRAYYHANKARKKTRRQHITRVSYYKNKPVSLKKLFFESIRKQIESEQRHRLGRALRNRVRMAVKQNSRAGSAVSDLGCSIPEFKSYIEDKFEPGMSWDNWGPDTWHLDHVKPLSTFDLTDRAQFLEACHYTNMQPLWATENLKKGAR